VRKIGSTPANQRWIPASLTSRTASLPLTAPDEGPMSDVVGRGSTIGRFYGQEHPKVGHFLNALGLTREHVGDLAGAAEAYRLSLGVKERTLGPENSALASTLGNLGWVETALGRLPEGEALLLGAIRLRERDLGPDHQYVANLMTDLGIVRRKRGESAAAMAALERALAIKEKGLGPVHEMVACTREEIARTHALLGDHAAALAEHLQVHAIREKVSGPDDPMTLQSLAFAGGELAALGRCAELSPLLEQKLARLDGSPARQALALTVLGRCAASPLVAEAHLARALALYEGVQGEAIERGTARWLRGRLLWARGRKAEARAAVRRAIGELGTDADGARDLAAARAWMIAHGGDERL
jgi:tetratricopeptide (TPR) repeat protein